MKQVVELRKYLFFLFLAIIIIGCSRDKVNLLNNDTIIAEVGKHYKVSLGDLKQYIKDWQYNQKYREKPILYNNALNDLIMNQLKRFDFFDRKLNENKDLMSKVRRSINREIINAYFDKKFVAKYVNDSTAGEAYKEMNKKIIYNEILLPIAEKASKQKIDSLKILALEIEKNINNDSEFEALVTKYSLNKTAVRNIKNITWSQSMNDPVASVAFQLQKGSTQVLYAYDGLHILKVIDIKKIKVEPFEEIKDEIISDLQKGYYQVYNSEYDDFRNELIHYNSIKWNEQALMQIVKWSKTDEFFGGAYKDTMQNSISNGNNFEILSYNKGIVNLQEFLRLLNEVVILNSNIELKSESVKEFISDAVYDDNVIKAAQKVGLEKELITPYTKSNIIKSRLIYLYNQAIIEESIPKPTSETLREFYEEQKDSIFYQLKKINIYTRIYSDSANAALEIKEINNGTPFEKVSDRWFVKTYIRERDGSLKSFRSKEPPYLAEAAFQLKLNEVNGPVEYQDAEKGKQFAIIKAINIQPEKQLTFDDVQGKRIVAEFENYYRQKISDELIAKLKQKYHVQIFEDELSNAIAAK